MRIGWFAIFCFLSLVYGAYAETPTAGMLLPSESVSVSDDALATAFNPAGLGFEHGFNAYYLKAYSGNGNHDDDSIFLAASKAGFSIERRENFSKYTLASGSPIMDGLLFGSSYSWFNSDNANFDKLSEWDLGLLLRPSSYLSAGATVKNLNRPKFRGEKTHRIYNFGLAIRPKTDRLTLSFDVHREEKISGRILSYGLEVVPINGITLRGSINHEKIGNREQRTGNRIRSFDIRFAINFSQVGAGTYNLFNRSQSKTEHSDGVAYAYISKERHPTKFSFRKIVIKADLDDIEEVITDSENDKDVAGAIFKLHNSDYGFGRLQELRDLIKSFRSHGKKTIAYLETCNTGTYMLASVCDQVVIHPSGNLDLVGLRSEIAFYKEGLDKLGIKAELERSGEYKSFVEPFTQTEMSEAYRETVNSILDDLYEQIIAAISKSRNMTQDEVKAKIDEGPRLPKKALQDNLVDRLAYEDELESLAKELMDKRLMFVNARGYLSHKLYDRDWAFPPKLALIKAEGDIATGESLSVPLFGLKIMGSETISKALRAAREDTSIKAVVLRIDSHGGLVLASDQIWREAMLTKKKKPLIVSMGSAAASGGYYIASPAHAILAQPGTITGSIGVLSGKYSLKDLYTKIGVNKEIIKRGDFADFYSRYREFSAEERLILKDQVDQLYKEFVERVSQGRNLPVEEIEAAAKGRVWTGRQAKEHKLVDELGGLQEAIALAKEKAGIDKNEKVEIINFTKRAGFPGLFGLSQIRQWAMGNGQ